MHISPMTGHPSLWQPGRVDQHSKWHAILAAILFLLIAALLWGIGRLTHSVLTGDFIAVIAFQLTNLIGLAYEYGQATGYMSREGIDPYDIGFNMIGSGIVCVVFMVVIP